MSQRMSVCLEIDNGQTKCKKCGHDLGSSKNNWKTGTIVHERPMNGAGGEPYQSRNHVLLRLFYCPGCKRQLGTETALKDHAFLEDVLFDGQVE